MKIIRLTAGSEVSLHDFPGGSWEEQNEALMWLIGNDCDDYENVFPRRLYQNASINNRVTEVPGECISMLVDEEGLEKELGLNPIASYLYGANEQVHPIVGDVLFVREKLGGGRFCGIEDSVVAQLVHRFGKLVQAIKNMEKELYYY